MNRLPWLAALLVSAALVLTTGCKPRELSSEEARELLAEVRQARQEVTLKGEVDTNVRLADTNVQAQAKVHRGDGLFQLEFTSGEVKGVKIIEQDRGVWQIAADGKAVRHLPRNPVDLPPFIGRDAVVRISPGSPMAGRPTDKIVIRPQSDAVARIEMWVDKTTRFPLGVDRYNNENMLVASTRYTSVDFSVPAPTAAELPEVTEQVAGRPQGQKTDKARAAAVLDRDPLEPKYLPQGFAFQGYYLHERGRGPAVELRYSDGVRLLSVLQSKLGQTGERRAGGPPGGRPPGVGEGRTGGEAGERPRRMREGGPAGEDGERARRMGEGGPAGEEGERPRRVREGGPGGDEGERPPRMAEGRGEPREGRPEEGEGGPEGAQRWRGRGEGRGEGDGGMMRSVLRGRIVRFRVEGLSVVVAGEISEDELNKVADSMRPVGTSF